MIYKSFFRDVPQELEVQGTVQEQIDRLNQRVSSGIDGTLKVRGVDKGWNATNVTEDKEFDADTVLVAELADVVGTLIAQLKVLGLLSA
jgi:hypothetical protein